MEAMQTIRLEPRTRRFDLLPPEEVARSFGTDLRRGLDPLEAEERLARFGPNELPPPKRERWPGRLLRQLKEPMALLLVVAAAVSGIGLRERIDAAAILAIVVLNAAIGLVQEGKAARALEALRTMETAMARARRGGTTRVVPSREVVPGDVVTLAAGDRVPADLRLVDAAFLEVDESLLTGESFPVTKDPRAVVSEAAGLGDRRSMAFTGTMVTRGSGLGIAVATGPSTELGAIAEHLREREPPTPLQVELARLTARLGTLAVLIAVAVFGLTLLRMGVTDETVQRAFLSAVALAVAAVPEGLATVVTVALALGVRRMAARGAIVRRLIAVETLGSTTVIATDKTGTLTENRLRLEAVALPTRPFLPLAEIAPRTVERIAEVAVLCNDAVLDPPSGDPLDVALLEAFGPERVRQVRTAHPRISVTPFDSERRRMTSVHRSGSGTVLVLKGAPESVLGRCTEAAMEDGTTMTLDEGAREILMAQAADMARRGIRVLALARRELPDPPGDPEGAERDLTFVALAGLRDPVRPEAGHSVAEARAAGVTVLMVTGDHTGTAAAVAQEVGLAAPGAPVTDGPTLRETGIPDDPLSIPIYARVDPDEKLALVEALQAGGHVVAVTGDGVNDAPALRRADIGVAMGRSGSDVAREAADMVVTDDNLATIVSAIREGRGIYDNVRKVVDYLAAGNLSEIAVVVVSLLLFPGLGVPLLPLQLLWVNLLTDGLPAIALGVDPPDPALMERPPRSRDDRLLSGKRVALLFGRGSLIAAASVGSLAIARFAWGEPWAHAQALMFTVLVVAHLLYAFAVRVSRRRPSPGHLQVNRWLLVAVGGGLLLQLLVVAWPGAHDLFGTAHLAPREWAVVVVGGVLPAALMTVLEGRVTSRLRHPPRQRSQAPQAAGDRADRKGQRPRTE